MDDDRREPIEEVRDRPRARPEGRPGGRDGGVGGVDGRQRSVPTGDPRDRPVAATLLEQRFDQRRLDERRVTGGDDRPLPAGDPTAGPDTRDRAAVRDRIDRVAHVGAADRLGDGAALLVPTVDDHLVDRPGDAVDDLADQRVAVEFGDCLVLPAKAGGVPAGQDDRGPHQSSPETAASVPPELPTKPAVLATFATSGRNTHADSNTMGIIEAATTE